ncbi:hypothetical protein MM221_03150 [Salipaludibacillus sp. LMS25]|jgi:hypothetical protein|uniref:ABC transporter C-terminal domain-containing protein n=1 Tax=Salipaludibacillus sp. LMS25 TaxID=2924031 RepID=UPI0020D0DBFA|nr:ABC transporter C-terminal domain-containing protein [Salipaludibacillus sp. LMS25]UTR15600.1 hypothetical protein MM221_03150 [Salipaludibacillus sp. LMS25]
MCFTHNIRLGISLPSFSGTWDELSLLEQTDILVKWEKIRGTIPDKIEEIERKINTLQSDLYHEENFEKSCKLNSDIAELASIINDLWIWYRAGDDVAISA